MRQVNSTDFKSHFGEFVDLARDEPIAVLRGNKRVGVFLSPHEYDHLQKLEEAYWVGRAQAAEAGGEWVGAGEALKLLTDKLKRSE